MQAATIDITTCVDETMELAWEAFAVYRVLPLSSRAAFMRAIALEITASGDALVAVCGTESHLPEARLRNELARTIFQLNSYADACEAGNWLEVRIDTALPDRNPPKPDIRKMQVPLGPVVVFGASNFPFAFSTAGGDTAAALAAGCPVIVKAHNAHLQTSLLMAAAIERAVEKCDMPKGVFSHITDEGLEAARQLVTHPYTKAVGFTGSLQGGKALWELANTRKQPIPVFAEMSSINPVFLLPGKMQSEAASVASLLAGSVTLGSGQFCTNPGLIIGLEDEALSTFMQKLAAEISQVKPATMLHPGIARQFRKSREKLYSQAGVQLLAETATAATDEQGIPSVATVAAADFIANPSLQHEVFGPFSLVVRCSDADQLQQVAKILEGQLTATLMATPQDLQSHAALVAEIQQHCGRVIVNQVPTGVEVCLAMQHGGPWPATTDPRFTSVGADSIKRFVRPVSFQNWPDELLAPALQNANPLNIWRTVNNQLTKVRVL